MSEEISFWRDLREHLETIGIIVGFAAFVVATYEKCFPRRTLEANHQRIVATLNWCTRGSWLSLMQAGIRWVIGLMCWLYGPPGDGDGSTVRQNLTVRAWKMSAWIAALILFLMPPMIIFSISTYYAYHATSKFDLEPLLYAFFVTLTLAIPFALTWRTVRRDDAFIDHTGIEDIEEAASAVIIEGTRLAIVIGAAAIMAWIATAGLEAAGLQNGIAYGLSIGLALAIALIALIVGLIRTIRRHGFLAPFAFVCILLVLLVYAAQWMLCFVLYEFVVVKTKLSGLWALPALYLTILCIRSAVSDHHSARVYDLLDNFFLLAVFTVGLLLLSDDIRGSVSAWDLLRLIGQFILGLLTPIVISLYAAIYANALPDWLSVALARSLFVRASDTARLSDFLTFLLYDVLCATGLCILTALVLIITFGVSGVIQHVSAHYLSVDGGRDMASILISSADFFLGGVHIIGYLPHLLDSWNAYYAAFSAPQRAGVVIQLLLVALSLTSLMPTLVNALTMLGSVDI
jgi:hypothetical protein